MFSRLALLKQSKVLPALAPAHSGVALTNVSQAGVRSVALEIGMVAWDPDSKIYDGGNEENE